LGIFASVGLRIIFIFLGEFFFHHQVTLKMGAVKILQRFLGGGHKVTIFFKGKKEVEIVIFRP
jgi:hypothetical protein